VAVVRRSSGSARGQHFLRSRRLAADLVRDAEVTSADLVVDVGAGFGVLTRALADTGARVIAVERDTALASGLRARFADRPLVSIVEADALAWRLPVDPFKVVANLPFAGSGAILSRLLRGPVAQADVIVEWGFAQKHVAVWPSTLKGTYWRAFYDVAILRRLDRSAFSPRPSVDAAVVRFTRRGKPLVGAGESDRYWRFLAGAFRSKNPIRGALTPLQAKRLAPALGFSLKASPRDLDARQWAAVYSLGRARPDRRSQRRR
jgi:23S rRNA (adenine-N6)-dimethyltransferase